MTSPSPFDDCRARDDASQLRHWQHLADQHRAESLARVDRVLEAVPAMPDDELIQRIRRVAAAISLNDGALVAASHVGRRRSRREKAADELLTTLAGQLRRMAETFDQIDEDMYLTVIGNQDAQAGLFALIAEGSA